MSLTINGTYVPIVGDFGGDDYDDILFYGPGSTSDSLWISVDDRRRTSTRPQGQRRRRLPAQGPARLPRRRRQGRHLVPRPGLGQGLLWHFTDRLGTAGYDGPGTYASRELKVNGAYQLVIGDYSGDAIDDVVLYQPGAAADYKWVSNAAGAFSQTTSRSTAPTSPSWSTAIDYDGIFWWASGSGRGLLDQQRHLVHGPSPTR